MNGPRIQAAVDATNDLFAVVDAYRGAGRPIEGPPMREWLLREARRAAPGPKLFDEICWRAVGQGLPLWRVMMSVATLHPQIFGFGNRWWRERNLTEEFRVRHGIDRSPEFQQSPMRDVVLHGATVRFRLDAAAEIERYPLLVDLRREGATDYFACPLTFFNGRHQAATWTTDRPGGFTAEHIAAIEDMMPAFAAVVEGKAMGLLVETLLDTYLGPTAGQQILSGRVRQGQGERLRAAILATDLRGFTTLSDRLPDDELITLLDDYFDAAAAAIGAHGGEVLKFAGDSVLAIFPAAVGSESAAADAISAAEKILLRLNHLNGRRAEDGRTLIRAGIGLHLGDIIFGNVGAANRLDFTAIGPAVNLAYRLEGLTKRLDRPLLLSGDIARACDRPLVSLGFHPVRGLSTPEEVFGLAQP